jgi:hypothetical protein
MLGQSKGSTAWRGAKPIRLPSRARTLKNVGSQSPRKRWLVPAGSEPLSSLHSDVAADSGCASLKRTM